MRTISGRIGSSSWQRGFGSILAVFFTISVVFFALTQTLAITTRSGPDIEQQAKSLRAAYWADSTQEYINGALSWEALNSSDAPSVVCDRLTTGWNRTPQSGVDVALTNLTTANDRCDIRVVACVGAVCQPQPTGFYAQRSSKSGSSFKLEGGKADTAPRFELTLTNKESKKGIAIINFAFKGLTGQAKATCEGCDVGETWYLETKSGKIATGVQGFAAAVAPLGTKAVCIRLDSTTCAEALPANPTVRSGVIAGLVFPSSETENSRIVIGDYADISITACETSGCNDRTFSISNGFGSVAGGAVTTVTRGPSDPATWTVPAGVTALSKVTVWGAGGGGGSRSTNGGGGGGGGGAVSIIGNLPVSPGQSVFLNIPAGGVPGTTRGDTWLNKTANATPGSTSDGVSARAGTSVANNNTTGGPGGATFGRIGTLEYAGGTGAAGTTGTGARGGGGGSSAGTAADGNNATIATGASAPPGGGEGGNGATTQGNGLNGTTPGGGGGGALRSGNPNRTGGSGGGGQVQIEYQEPETGDPWCRSPSPDHPTKGADLLIFLIGGAAEDQAGSTHVQYTQSVTIDPSGQAIRMGEWPDGWWRASPIVCPEGTPPGLTGCSRKPFEFLTHYPRLDSPCTPTSSAGCFDNAAFSEVFYTYNSYLYGAIQTVTTVSDGTEVELVIGCGGTNASPCPATVAELPNPGTFLKTLNASFPLRARTRVLSGTLGSDTVTLRVAAFTTAGVKCTGTNCSVPVASPPAGTVVCGGVCALLSGFTLTASTEFNVRRVGSNSSRRWAGGFVCARAGKIDPVNDIKFVVGSASRQGSVWEEELSD